MSRLRPFLFSPVPTMLHESLSPYLALFVFSTSVLSQQLPYNPTRILLPPENDDYLAYIIQPSSSGVSKPQLLAVENAATIRASDIPFATLTPSLPFGENEAFTPVIDQGGSIHAYTGDCQDGSSGAQLWSSQPSSGSTQWTQENVTAESQGDSLAGANYLASAVAFSSITGSDPSIYIFGGMCPTANSNPGSWQSSANYSNSVLELNPSSAANSYVAQMADIRGAPIAEAGFSTTPLLTTYSNSSNGAQTQQQNLVFLGGHTEQAFINISQIALFSLPEESWTFVSIALPATSGKTDLVRDTAAVEPRSGHTAVLTPDATKIVVFGGWVGDVDTPANPQLVVVNIGEGYGGTGDWTWTIPEQPSGHPSLYGHGAAMLPDGVMMIAGGFQMGSPASRVKRSSSSSSSQFYFYNTTSGQWLDSYVRPKASKSTASSSKSARAAKTVGLGAGLSLGFSAVAAASLVFWLYARRLRLRREARDQEIRDLANSAHRPDSAEAWTRNSTHEMSQTSYPWNVPPSSSGFGEGSGWKEADAERTGLLLNIPSPTRGLRRSMIGRAQYQAPSRYEETRRGHGAGRIHPIDESEEYEEEKMEPRPPRPQDVDIVASAPILDPFTNHHHSRTPSPESPAEQREREVRGWVNDWEVAEVMMQNPGRESPEKTDRTSSTLSEQSMRSNMSTNSIQRSTAGTVSRSGSRGSAALLRLNPFSSETDAAHTGPREQPRSQSLTLSGRDTFSTAAAPSLYAEGESLLGGMPKIRRDTSRIRTAGLFGSMRRVLTGDRTMLRNDNSAQSSPTKHHDSSTAMPRRSASASATLLRGKRGAADWDASAEKGDGSREGADHGGPNDDDWDVEAAVERRLVQVMFTVPRERLRVVNADPDDVKSLRSAKSSKSLKSSTGSGKVKDMVKQIDGRKSENAQEPPK